MEGMYFGAGAHLQGCGEDENRCEIIENMHIGLSLVPVPELPKPL